ncbi:hypothetical protein [Shinella zoogloeoides]
MKFDIAALPFSPTARRGADEGVPQGKPGLLTAGRIGRFHVEPDIAAGALVLEDFDPGDIEIVHALFAGHQHLTAHPRLHRFPGGGDLRLRPSRR